MVRSADGARESKLGGETTQEKLRKMKALQVVAKQALPSELLPPSEPNEIVKEGLKYAAMVDLQVRCRKLGLK